MQILYGFRLSYKIYECKLLASGIDTYNCGQSAGKFSDPIPKDGL
jgi:hypothetical protein